MSWTDEIDLVFYNTQFFIGKNTQKPAKSFCSFLFPTFLKSILCTLNSLLN